VTEHLSLRLCHCISRKHLSPSHAEFSDRTIWEPWLSCCIVLVLCCAEEWFFPLHRIRTVDIYMVIGLVPLPTQSKYVLPISRRLSTRTRIIKLKRNKLFIFGFYVKQNIKTSYVILFSDWLVYEHSVLNSTKTVLVFSYDICKENNNQKTTQKSLGDF